MADNEDEEEQMYYCIEQDGIVTLQRLLQSGFSPNTKFSGVNQLGKSLLHLCCEKGRYECAKLLLDHGARAGVQDKWHQTPLMYSVNTGRDDMVRLLLSHRFKYLNERDRFGMSALHFAAKGGFVDCIKLLLEAGCEVNIADATGRTPIWLAAAEEEDRVECLRALIEAGGNINLVDMKQERSALFVAIANRYSSRARTVKILLEFGADPNVIDIFASTPMMFLIRKIRVEAKGVSDLDFEIARLLLEHGHNPDICTVKKKMYQIAGNALMFCAEFGCLPIMELLLDYGANPDVLDQEGKSPIYTAIASDEKEAMKILLAANCRLDIYAEVVVSGNDKKCLVTPFKYAVLLDKVELCECMINAGYDLSAEPYIWTNHEVPNQLVLNLELWTWLIDCTRNPRNLKLLCCIMIRKLLKSKVHKKVNDLDIPPGLKGLILLQYL